MNFILFIDFCTHCHHTSTRLNQDFDVLRFPFILWTCVMFIPVVLTQMLCLCAAFKKLICWWDNTWLEMKVCVSGLRTAYHYGTWRMHQCLQLIQVTLSLNKERGEAQIRSITYFYSDLKYLSLQIQSVWFPLLGLNKVIRLSWEYGHVVQRTWLNLVPLSFHDMIAKLGGRGVLQSAARLLHQEVHCLTANNI